MKSRLNLPTVLFLLASFAAACASAAEVASATPALIATPTLRPTPQPSPTALRDGNVDFIQRPFQSSLRVMSYNINWDSIFPDDDLQNHDLRLYNREGAFARILRAVNPDVLCLQEINYLRSTADLAIYLGNIFGDGSAWQLANVRDTVIATRFELLEDGYELNTGSYLPTLPQAAALIDLPEEMYGAQDLYMICAHFKSGGGLADILLRGRQADAIAAHIGDAVSSGGEFDLRTKTPFVILGDFNIYDTDPALHLRTLLRGDIYDEAYYGEDIVPDWDGSVLADAMPSHNGRDEMFYTWRNDAEPFNPRALDRIIYSDSVLRIENAFILNTVLLDDQALAALGLQQNDVLLDVAQGYYDHLPLVVDFGFSATE
jgi:endonuclease/exonuclease/phosphatase family metal-dependent hydrolase